MAGSTFQVLLTVAFLFVAANAQTLWQPYPLKFFGDYAAGDSASRTLAAAQTACINYGSACAAVTCTSSAGTSCTVRAGTTPGNSPTEYSYFKVTATCGAGYTKLGAGGCSLSTTVGYPPATTQLTGQNMSQCAAACDARNGCVGYDVCVGSNCDGTCDLFEYPTYAAKNFTTTNGYPGAFCCILASAKCPTGYNKTGLGGCSTPTAAYAPASFQFEGVSPYQCADQCFAKGNCVAFNICVGSNCDGTCQVYTAPTYTRANFTTTNGYPGAVCCVPPSPTCAAGYKQIGLGVCATPTSANATRLLVLRNQTADSCSAACGARNNCVGYDMCVGGGCNGTCDLYAAPTFSPRDLSTTSSAPGALCCVLDANCPAGYSMLGKGGCSTVNQTNATFVRTNFNPALCAAACAAQGYNCIGFDICTAGACNGTCNVYVRPNVSDFNMTNGRNGTLCCVAPPPTCAAGYMPIGLGVCGTAAAAKPAPSVLLQNQTADSCAAACGARNSCLGYDVCAVGSGCNGTCDLYTAPMYAPRDLVTSDRNPGAVCCVLSAGCPSGYNMVGRGGCSMGNQTNASQANASYVKGDYTPDMCAGECAAQGTNCVGFDICVGGACNGTCSVFLRPAYNQSDFNMSTGRTGSLCCLAPVPPPPPAPVPGSGAGCKALPPGVMADFESSTGMVIRRCKASAMPPASAPTPSYMGTPAPMPPPSYWAPSPSYTR